MENSSIMIQGFNKVCSRKSAVETASLNGPLIFWFAFLSSSSQVAFFHSEIP